MLICWFLNRRACKIQETFLKGLTLSEPQLEPSKVTCCTSLTLSRRSRKMQRIGNPEHLWHVELGTENHAKYKKLPANRADFLKTWMFSLYLLISLKRQKQRYETNTFELIVTLARRFCERTLWKPSRSVQNASKPFKTLGTEPYTGRDARVRFSWRPLPSNRADFLKTSQISLYFLKTS